MTLSSTQTLWPSVVTATRSPTSISCAEATSYCAAPARLSVDLPSLLLPHALLSQTSPDAKQQCGRSGHGRTVAGPRRNCVARRCQMARRPRLARGPEFGDVRTTDARGRWQLGQLCATQVCERLGRCRQRLGPIRVAGILPAEPTLIRTMRGQLPRCSAGPVAPCRPQGETLARWRCTAGGRPPCGGQSCSLPVHVDQCISTFYRPE